MNFDYLILGNGAIGMVTAIKLKEAFPSARICILGASKRLNSASVAAGAMCNVFGEVEHAFSPAMKSLQDLSLNYGIAGRNGWENFLHKYSLFGKVQTADKTLIFLKRGASSFEENNYVKAKQISIEAGVLGEIENTDLSSFFSKGKNLPSDAFLIKGEFALDTKELFTAFNTICSSLGITQIDACIQEVDVEENKVITDSGEFKGSRIIVALGAETQSVLDLDDIQPILRGVGTAFQISNKKIESSFASNSMVIRTVNRGGAQCGFHFVPRNNGYYLGAGNYIKAEGESSHRLETLRYLIQTFENELGGSEITYQLEGDIIKGHRPRALDGYPLIGSLSKNDKVFIASGTNRAGLTWAPAIANQIIAWASEKSQEILTPELYQLLKPDRSPISFGTEIEAVEYYVESRIGAALEHSKIENQPSAIESEKTRLQKYASELLSEVQGTSGDYLVPHPDHWAAILDSPSLCVEFK